MKLNKWKIYSNWVPTFVAILLIPLLFSAIGTNKAYSQDIQRQVNYCTITKTFCAIPACIEESQITDLDRIKMTYNDLYECVEDMISDYRLITTTYYPQMPRWENDYQYEIGKAVVFASGMFLYDHDGNEIISHENEELNENFIIPSEMIDFFGLYNQTFDIDAEDAMQKLEEGGFAVYEHEGFVIGIADEFEFAINLTDFITEMRFFSDTGTATDRILTRLHRVEHIMTDYGFIIPVKETEVTYDTLPSNIPYEITQEKSYLSYQVIDGNGDEIVSMEFTPPSYAATPQDNEQESNIGQFEEIQQRKIQMCIFPNPANNQLSVSLPFYMDKEVDITISNSVGQVVFSQHYQIGRKIDIDIRSLPAGVYVIRCSKDNKVVSKLFVKH